MRTSHIRHDIELEGHKLVALGFNTHLTQTPIIFIHGITASINCWLYGGPPMLANYPWYSLSLPGHYPAKFPSEFSASDLTPELIARLLGTAVQQLSNNRPVILVGHSTGGFAALLLAATYPDIVESVACISGFVEGRWTGVLALMQWLARNGRLGQTMFKANYRLIGHSPWLYRQALRFYAKDTDNLYNHPDLEPFIALNHPDAKNLDSSAMLIWFQKMPQTDIASWLDRIIAPTLVMFGDCDPIVPPTQGELIAARLSQSRKVIFPGTGHLPTTERADMYQKALTAWLKNEDIRFF